MARRPRHTSLPEFRVTTLEVFCFQPSHRVDFALGILCAIERSIDLVFRESASMLLICSMS